MIPALLIGRGGSRGVPGKNVMPILGRPLMVYPLLAAHHAQAVDGTFLSTDDDAIREIGLRYGTTLIERPPELATDQALVEDVVVHGYKSILRAVGEVEMIVLLFCNSATITPGIIDQGVARLRDDPSLDSAVTVSMYNEYSPVRAMRVDEAGLLTHYVDVEQIPGASCDRDSAAPAWFCDCSAWVLRPRCMHIERGRPPFRWIGYNVAPLFQSGGLDIDHGYGINHTEWWLRKHGFSEESTPYDTRRLNLVSQPSLDGRRAIPRSSAAPTPAEQLPAAQLFGIIDFLREASVEQEILGPDARVTCFDCRSGEALPEALLEQDVLMLWHRVALDRAALERLSRCRTIVRVGVGWDNVDIGAASELGIPVVNVPDYGTNDVADHTFALLLSLTRRLSRYERALRQDPVAGWDPGIGGHGMHRLTGQRLGIVGFGRIGSAVAFRARAFGIQVGFYDPYLPPGVEKSWQVKRYTSLESLFAESSIISVHVPLTPVTRGFIDHDLLSVARPGLILLNTGRGDVIQIDAIYDSLRSGMLGGFGADVLEAEPPEPRHPLIAGFVNNAPWLEGRLVLTPHCAFYSEECERELRVKAARLMAQAAAGTPLPNCVNATLLQSPRTPILPPPRPGGLI